jgi:hypothetical protein
MFTRDAVVMIHERSQGIPRTISAICDNALLTGFALGRRLVDTKIIREVARDFDLWPGEAPLVRPEAGPKVVAEDRGKESDGESGSQQTVQHEREAFTDVPEPRRRSLLDGPWSRIRLKRPASV